MTTYDYTPIDRVIGRNPEYADMSNPQGFIFGLGFRIFGSDNYGNRYIYLGDITDEDHADRLVEGFTKCPVDHEDDPNWRWYGYVYGSEAFIDNQPYSEMALMDDEELQARRY